LFYGDIEFDWLAGMMAAEASNKELTSSAQSADWDVFLSYALASEEDKNFAVRLQRALVAYRTPLFSGLRPRRLRVFRDETEASGNQLSLGITRALRGSRKLLVLCSPASRVRPWINEEVREFAEFHGHDNIVPLLLAGRPDAEANAAGVPNEAAFPFALTEVLGPEPWAADFRSIRNSKSPITSDRFAWYHLLATLYGTTRRVIEQRERMRLVTRIIAASLFTALLGVAAYRYLKIDAEKVSVALANQADAEPDNEFEMALRTSLRAVEKAPTPEAIAALQRRILGLLKLRGPDRPLVSMDSSGNTIAIASPLGGVRVVNQANQSQVDICGHVGPFEKMELSPDGSTLILFDGLKQRLVFWDLSHNSATKRPVDWSPADDGGWLVFSPNSRTVVSTPYANYLSLWRLPGGEPIGELNIGGQTATYASNGNLLVQHDRNEIGYSKNLIFLNPETGAQLNIVPQIGDFEFLRFAAQDKKVIVAVNSEAANRLKSLFVVVDLSTGVATANVRSFDYNNFDFRQLLSASTRGFDKNELRDYFAARLQLRYPKLKMAGLSSLLLADSANVAVAQLDAPPYVLVFDPETLVLDPQLQHIEEMQPNSHELAISRDGAFIAAYPTSEGWLQLWSARTGSLLWQKQSVSGRIAFSGDTTRLFLNISYVTRDWHAVEGGSIEAFDTLSGKSLGRLTPAADDRPATHQNTFAPLTLLHVDSGGRRVVAKSDNVVYIWDVDNGRVRQLLEPDRASVERDQRTLAGTPDSVQLLEIGHRWLRDCR
jgi:WD40 repeat protein